jgi:hypothetical protein
MCRDIRTKLHEYCLEGIQKEHFDYISPFLERRLKKALNMFMGIARPGTKNDSAGEGHYKFSRNRISILLKRVATNR